MPKRLAIATLSNPARAKHPRALDLLAEKPYNVYRFTQDRREMLLLVRKRRWLRREDVAALLCVACLVLGLFIPAFAADPEESDVIQLSRQARATRYSLAPATQSQPERLLDRLSSEGDRAKPNSAIDENRFRLIPLDPQLDTPDKPAARPLPYARSYLFSLGTPERSSSYVGLAKIGREQNNPLLGLQEKQYNWVSRRNSTTPSSSLVMLGKDLAACSSAMLCSLTIRKMLLEDSSTEAGASSS